MDIGLFLPLEPAGRSPREVYSGVIDVAQAAEDLGLHSIWIASRHLSAEYASVPSPLVLLAAVASQTERIRLGTAVVSMPLESTFRLAEDFATLDAISRGRARLGVGSGDDPPAFEAMGVPFESHKEVTSQRVTELIGIFDSGNVGGMKLHPPISEGKSKLALGAQSVGGARWAGELGIGLLQGRAEPGNLDPTASQAAAAKPYREVHPEGRVVTSRNAWIGSLEDQELAEAIARYDGYLRARGRAPLPEGLAASAEKMHILTGEPEELATKLASDVASISPDELLVTVDPGGMEAGLIQKRLSELVPHLLARISKKESA
ncbi:MAG: LLM class flavin-dependent oxidoreductase [Actinobacteria bacterium]|nr:LLM class flavin-dependent oxidoreductase [Actinomycetota bacterium]